MDPRDMVVEAFRQLSEFVHSTVPADAPWSRGLRDHVAEVSAALKAHDAAKAQAGEGVPVAWDVVDRHGKRVAGPTGSEEDATLRCNCWNTPIGDEMSTRSPFSVRPLYTTPPRAALEAVAKEAVALKRYSDTRWDAGKCGLNDDEIIARAVAKVKA